MRLANPFNHSLDSIRSTDRSTPQFDSGADPADRVGDALASACLFGIVGGLVFALVLVPTVPVILIGAAIGAVAGVAIAYQ